jgi:S1-C subfamily serine protease
VEDITEHMFRSYLLQTEEGVYVDFVEVGSAADKGDLMAGDIIIQVNDKKVADLEQFKKIIENIGKPDYIMFRVLRGKDYAFALLDFTEEPAEDTKKGD